MYARPVILIVHCALLVPTLLVVLATQVILFNIKVLPVTPVVQKVTIQTVLQTCVYYVITLARLVLMGIQMDASNAKMDTSKVDLIV